VPQVTACFGDLNTAPWNFVIVRQKAWAQRTAKGAEPLMLSGSIHQGESACGANG
jgi:hypothetical protein